MRIADNSHISNIVQNGYKITFLSATSRLGLSEELRGGPELPPYVHKFLVKVAAEEVTDRPRTLYFSRLFLVSKPDGSKQLILDLRMLHIFLCMGVAFSIHAAMEPGESASMFDAFCHVLLAEPFVSVQGSAIWAHEQSMCL